VSILAQETVAAGLAVGRRLGAWGREDGPRLVILGGIHGNESAGVLAARAVLAELRRLRPPAAGRVAALAGNLAALQADERYLDRDLNRMWGPGPAPDGEGEDGCREAVERRELLAALRQEVVGAPGEVFFLDLHTSSAAGLPFACIGDTLRNRRFARAFPVPVILGLEEQVDGALLEYLNNAGLVTLGFEGGQHRAAAARENHEAAIWLALAAAGVLEPPWPEPVRAARRLLDQRRGERPRVLEVRHHHAVTPGDGFQMTAGFHNFDRVRAGQLLARDRGAEIRAPEDGRVLLPLYQGRGDDGFFLAREFRPFWLRCSACLRRLRLDRLARLLPGVRRDPEQPHTLLVDPRIARWYPVQVFHLLGYRKQRRRGARLAFTRRAWDLRRPSAWRLPEPESRA